MKSVVMVTKYGFAVVEGDTEEEKKRKTDEMEDREFEWTKRDWRNAEIVEDVDAENITMLT